MSRIYLSKKGCCRPGIWHKRWSYVCYYANVIHVVLSRVSDCYFYYPFRSSIKRIFSFKAYIKILLYYTYFCIDSVDLINVCQRKTVSSWICHNLGIFKLHWYIVGAGFRIVRNFHNEHGFANSSLRYSSD